MAKKLKRIELQPWQDPKAKPYIHLEGVSKEFRGTLVVDDVTLSIYQGEFFSLLGPSGCGKTTLLRMLAGLEMPTQGKIYIDGVDVTRRPAYDRPVNMMFQSYALFPHMTVEQNVAFGLKQERIPKAEIRERVREALRLVQMDKYGARQPHQLSGGQRQRVALARSLVKRPKLLLLDEPLAALDKRLREQTQFELVNIQEEVGITFILVTHDQEEAMTLSDRIVVMNQGEIEQIGTPEAIYARPRTKFVADFIGKQTNFLSGKVVGISDGRQEVEFWNRTFPFKGYDHLKKGDAVTLVIRPEMIDLSSEEGICNGEVTLVTYLGSEVNYEVNANNQVFAVQVSNPLKTGVFRAGDRVCLNFDLKNIYLIKA